MLRSTVALLLALKLTPGVGNVPINRIADWLAETEISPSELLECDPRTLTERLPAGYDREARGLAACREADLVRAEGMLARVESSGASAIARFDSDYPHALRAAMGATAPPLLFVAGDPGLLESTSVGVVGTRRPSDGGIALTKDCVAQLVARDATIVSGAAEGVDTTAHAATLASGGRTALVLPEGLFSYRGSQELVRGTEEGNVLLLSEFLPTATWSTHGAITRNSTIAALSSVVCVIEPGETGGSIRTAREALRMGRPTFVFGGRHAAGAKILASEGAALLVNSEGELRAEALAEALEAGPVAAADQGELF